MKWLGILALALMFSSSAFAEPSTRLPNSIDHQSLSVRALGMGGALTAAVDDYNALAYNPAALAFLPTFQIHGTIAAGMDSDMLPFTSDLSDAIDSSSDSTAQTTAVLAVLEKYTGKEPNARITPLYGAWVWKGMGFSVTPADISLELAIDQQVGPSVDVTSTADTKIELGYGREIKRKNSKMAWGVTAKVIHRVFYQDTLTAAQLIDDTDLFRTEDADEGLTVDLDLGYLYSPNVPQKGFFKFLKYMKPTFALVVRNAIDYGFTTNLNIVDDNSGEPPKLGRRFDVGSKFELPKWWVFYPRFALDVRDIGHENWNFMKGFHSGFELEWIIGNMWRGAWRVGLNQGYLSAGLTAKLLWFELGAATWGEEIGVAGARAENRRYLANLSMDF